MRRVLGIDPGLQRTGYALVGLPDGALEPELVEAGVFALDTARSLEDRLVQLHDDLARLIAESRPQCVAVEKLYAHYRHPRTAILMGHARGVILLCARQQGAPVVNLPATEIKKAITGFGRASKLQMQLAVAAQCGLAEPPSPPDVADAIAAALVCARRLAMDAC